MVAKLARPSTLLLASLAVVTAATSACVKGRKTQNADEVDVPEKPVDDSPVAAQRSTAAILEVRAELKDDGVHLHVGGVPSGARLECDIGAVAIPKCHDGAVLATPAVGDHTINVSAIVGSDLVAIGASAPFTVMPTAQGTPTAPGEAAVTKDSLTMIVDDAAFTNGMTVPLTADFKVRFKLAAAPACKAEILCKYDSRTSKIWTDCDDDGRSFLISKDLLASGLQYLSVQASCQDQQGPILNMFFYGVPDGYKPLMLRNLKDGLGRHVVNLVKGDDCPENLQRYECSANAAEPFALCANGNVIDKPAPGYRVRLSCGGTQGPELTLSE